MSQIAGAPPRLRNHDLDETLAALTTARPQPDPEPPATRLRRLLSDADAWTIIN